MKKSIVALLLVLSMVLGLVGCGKVVTPTPTATADPSATPSPTQGEQQNPTDGPTAGPTAVPTIPKTTEVEALKFKAGTVIRMACGYNDAKTGIAFDASVAGEGKTLANGKTYYAGDLKPTWERVQEVLGMKFEDHYQGKKASDEYEFWKEKLSEIDMVAGTASQLSEAGVEGNFVNLADYLDRMPNFKAYLDANSIVRLSITGSTTGDNKGAIYFSPYFDGVDDIERMPLMRTDWVVKLLDGDKFEATESGKLQAAKYEPYMPVTGSVKVDVVKLDASGVETVTKDYSKYGNIVKVMNDALAKGDVTGIDAVNMLRDYIDKTYNGYYGKDRSNLFIGQNAAWDADELVALLRCVCANAKTLNGTDVIQGLFSRENSNLQRQVDVFRFAGILFGVRGLESRSDYLWIDETGALRDARQDVESYQAMERVRAMAEEGLVSSSFLNGEDIKTDKMLEQDLGFMHYDYNQTQTVYNQTKLNKDGQTGEKYMAVMIPVAKWFDGTNKDGVYMRFTESWRSVKTDGWAISKAGVANDNDKLNACLSLIDYAYSPEGQILMSYGPDEFIKKNADGSYVTFDFNGTQMPVIADETYAELWEKEGGNYTNYARRYLGSTLSFLKSQAFEFQCTHEVGREGASKISYAIKFGTIKHPLLEVAENPWYTSIPTVLPNTKEENATLKGFSDLTNNFSSSNGKYNIYIDLIQKGYEGNTLELGSADACAKAAQETWKGVDYLDLKQEAWDRLVYYYNEITK